MTFAGTMRPSLLDPLFVPITALDGVGPKIATLIEKVVPADLSTRGARAGDVLFTLPHTLIDRRNRPGIAYSAQGAIVTLDVRVDRHQPPPRGNRSVPYRVFVHDDTGEAALTFFHANAIWSENGSRASAFVSSDASNAQLPLTPATSDRSVGSIRGYRAFYFGASDVRFWRPSWRSRTSTVPIPSGLATRCQPGPT